MTDMIMLSAQCDELRQMATRYDEPQAGAVKAVTMPSNMGPILRDAADTIWELRCKCADLMGEREEYVWTWEFMDRMAKHCGTKDCPSLVAYVEGLEAENARLRELMRHMHTCMEHYEMDGTISCDRCPLDNDTGNCDFERRMRELGVDE